MRARLALGLLALGGPLAAQDAPAGRWAIRVLGPAAVERGDLRLEPDGARVLLEGADSMWQLLPALLWRADTVAFATPIGGRRFEGRLVEGRLVGTVREPDGRELAWEGEPVLPGYARWPVRPRVRVRQLVVGSASTASAFPGAWVEAARETGRALADLRPGLQVAAGIGTLSPARAADAALGFDPAMRRTLRRALAQVATTPAGRSREYARLFGPGWLDVHEAALAIARRNHPGLDVASVARQLQAKGMLANGPVDTLAVMRTIWRAWSALPTGTTVPIAAPTDSLAAASTWLRAYEDATAWWHEAVQWLLVAPWLETATGWTSPVALMRDFWGDSTLALPTIQPSRFGAPQAVPVFGIAAIGARLVQPVNAAAPEWLAREGLGPALEAWRAMTLAGDPVTLMAGDQPLPMLSPSAVAASRLGGFLAAEDAIRIEPGFIPLLAVATVIHEWHHLVAERTRLGIGGPGVRDATWGLRLRDADPWLAEGIAEWATDATLAPVRASFPLWAAFEATKRAGIARESPDDTHVLGHLLVHAAARQLGPDARATLVALQHDPAALARRIGLEAGPVVRLARPSTLALIPEVTFTFDDGVADRPVRRVRLPDSPLELR